MKASLLDINEINGLFRMVKIITKNNSFEIKVSPPRSLLDSLSNYFLLVKDGIMSKHRRLLVHIKGKKILRISALCQHKGIFNNAIPTWQRTGHTGTSYEE